MPDLPKAFFNFGADWLTTITRQHLRRQTNFAHQHDLALTNLLTTLAPTIRGRTLRMKARMNREQFVANIPLSRHENITDFVEQMRAGKKNVMAPGKTELFATTAGTTTGTPRIVPVPPAMVEHFYRMSRYVALNATARAGSIDALRGRLLLLGGQSHFRSPPDRSEPSSSYPTTSDLSTLAATYKTQWINRHFFEPTTRIALEPDWSKMVDRIVRRARDRNISLIAGQPQWLIPFAHQVLDLLTESKQPHTSLQAIWPKLRTLIYTGSSIQTSRLALQKLAGPGVMLHEVYSAAEGIFAVQGHHPGPGLRLLADSGIYFEFLPVADYNPKDLDASARLTVPLADVDTKTDYLLVVTTPAGLVRHIVGDVVRFSKLRPHYLYPVGQIELRLSTFGEHLLARDMATALLHSCEINKWKIRHLHVAPISETQELGQHRGRHEWWVELEASSQVTPTGPLISSLVDLHLTQKHPSYAARRQSGQIAPPVVRLVMPGSFEHWLRHSNLWGGPHKLPITRNDRSIADGLKGLVRFSDD